MQTLKGFRMRTLKGVGHVRTVERNRLVPRRTVQRDGPRLADAVGFYGASVPVLVVFVGLVGLFFVGLVGLFFVGLVGLFDVVGLVRGALPPPGPDRLALGRRYPRRLVGDPVVGTAGARH